MYLMHLYHTVSDPGHCIHSEAASSGGYFSLFGSAHKGEGEGNTGFYSPLQDEVFAVSRKVGDGNPLRIQSF